MSNKRIAPEGMQKFKVRRSLNEILASVGLSGKGVFYPAVDPLDSTSTLLQPRSLPKDVKIPHIQSISMISAWDEGYQCGIDPEGYVDRMRRRGRKVKAEEFRREYFYDRSMDKKTCIWPGGSGFSWLDYSSGITWVGVHGNDSICVVTKAGDVDLTRVHSFLNFRTKEEVLCSFRRTVISEIEDLADPHSKIHEMCGKSIQAPFGVVSVVPLNGKVHKEYDEKKAIEFLREKVNRGEDFSLEGTIQIAISLFQHLFEKRFKANEIEVSVMDPEYFVCGEESYYKDIYVKHLETLEIEEHLADMKEPRKRRIPCRCECKRDFLCGRCRKLGHHYKKARFGTVMM